MQKSVLAELVTKMTVESAQFKKELEKASARTVAYGKKAKAAANDSDAFNFSLRGVGKTSNIVRRSIGGLIATLGINKLRVSADLWTELNSKIRLVSDSEQELISTRSRLLSLSTDTRTNLTATVDLYTRLERSTGELNVSQSDLLSVTRAINQSFIISGATTAETTSSITQLTQALASGVLRGQEFNSISEQSPRLLTILATQLGVTRGELREMAKQGKLTSEIVFNAIKDGSKVIGKEFEQTEQTTATALQNMGTAFTTLVGKIDDATGASSSFSKVLNDIATQALTFADGTESVASLNVELDQLRRTRVKILESGFDTKHINRQIDGVISKLSALRAQAEFEKTSSATKEDILSGVFANPSESAGDAGIEEGKQFADTMFTAFTEQLAFNAETLEIPNLLGSDLSQGATLTAFDELAKAEIEAAKLHRAELERIKEESLKREQQFEAGNFAKNLQLAGQKSKKIAALGKAAAIAQATIKTYESAQSAYAAFAPIPIVGPALGIAAAAAAVAAGLANVAAIRSTPLAGAREMGGPVRGGSSYLVGERGPEIFTPSATGQITSNANMQRAMNGSNRKPQPSMTMNFSPNIYTNDRNIIDELKREMKPFARMVKELQGEPV